MFLHEHEQAALPSRTGDVRSWRLVLYLIFCYTTKAMCRAFVCISHVKIRGKTLRDRF
jgi:hypothetical protein